MAKDTSDAALESVRGAKDEGIELVIVDDGSSDRTLEIIHDLREAPSDSY